MKAVIEAPSEVSLSPTDLMLVLIALSPPTTPEKLILLADVAKFLNVVCNEANAASACCLITRIVILRYDSKAAHQT
jgi:hypothetical protein